MSVGNQATVSGLNNTLSNYATNLRNYMTGVSQLSTFINGQGNGLQALEQIGFGSTANTSNPGGVSDAQLALSMIAYLNTIAGVYFGTVQSGGAGGTGAITFNFDQELSTLWGGQ